MKITKRRSSCSGCHALICGKLSRFCNLGYPTRCEGDFLYPEKACPKPSSISDIYEAHNNFDRWGYKGDR